jgi:putative transcriptional regulator
MTKFLKHHPDPEMLVEFSAGTLDTALSICVSAHLHYCESCRAEVARLNEIGSHLLESSEPAEIDDQLFDKVMHKIDSAESVPVKTETDKNMPNYPSHIKKLISSAKSTPVWKRLTSSMDVAKLITGQNKFEVALHRICAGGSVPKHDHKGTEYTVVLKGSFSDEQSVYTEGDFLVRNPGDIHQPMGAKNGECICLSALEAPIKLDNPLGFLFRPWLKINPM